MMHCFIYKMGKEHIKKKRLYHGSHFYLYMHPSVTRYNFIPIRYNTLFHIYKQTYIHNKLTYSNHRYIIYTKTDYQHSTYLR